MAQASDYPITFPYGATGSPYSSTRPHRGDDRAAPHGTSVTVEGKQIGLVGSTGLSTGPHLHLQEWQGTPANTRKPQNSFKGGTVVAATAASDFGNYVTIQTSDGWNDTYAHLSRIDVKVGQVIGGDMQATEDFVNKEYTAKLGRLPGPNEAVPWIGRDAGQVASEIYSSTEAQARRDYVDGLQKFYDTYKNEDDEVQIKEALTEIEQAKKKLEEALND